MAVEHRGFGVGQAQAGGRAVVADEPAERRRGAAGAGPSHDPGRHRVRLLAQLAEDRLGDVVVAPPVGSPLGIGELVHVVAPEIGGLVGALRIDLLGGGDEMGLAPVEFDLRHLLGRGGPGHHRDEPQAQQPGEIGLGHRRRSAGGLDDRRLGPNPAVAQGVEEQRSGQPVLQAAGGMGGLVLEIEVHRPGQGRAQQVGVGRAVEVGLNGLDGPVDPGAVTAEGGQGRLQAQG